MKTSPVGGGTRRETIGVLALTTLIVVGVGIYLGLSSWAVGGSSRSLMPYQVLAKDLVGADQRIFSELQGAMKEAEAQRAATGKWPDAGVVPRLMAVGNDATTPGSTAPYSWKLTQQGFFVNYLGMPQGDTSGSAWLMMVQEPDPASLVDPAPEDEVHHKLPDGTMLHATIWTHRYGRQVVENFLQQPQLQGWVQVLVAPVTPVATTPKR